MRLDFFPHQWTQLIETCGFTDEELEIIALRRRYGTSWTNRRYSMELNIAERTYYRRVSRIRNRIKKIMADNWQ